MKRPSHALPARRYLFSCNGKFGDPDRETFELLLSARSDEEMEFVLSYSLEEFEEGRKRDRDKQKEISDPKAWMPAADPLKAGAPKLAAA